MIMVKILIGTIVTTAPIIITITISRKNTITTTIITI